MKLSRHYRLIHAFALGIASWWGMQGLHEAGHVLAARQSGHAVQAVELPLAGISRTATVPDPPSPFVIWAGPVFGVLAPLLAWGAAVWRRCRCAAELRFFAGLCLIANGAYLGAAFLTPVGDAADLLRAGTPLWMLMAWGATSVVSGFRVWHGAGQQLGWGASAAPVSGRRAVIVVILTLVLASVIATAT